MSTGRTKKGNAGLISRRANIESEEKAMSQSFEVTDEQDDIIIRFDKNLVDRQALSKLLRYIEMESIRKRIQLTEEQATMLADEIDQAVWERVKHKYVQA